jgi:hypothetical protein
MIALFFSLEMVASYPPVEIGLLVGGLLLVIGLLLLLIPRSEQRLSRPHFWSQPRTPKGAKPGRRILSEEAKVSRGSHHFLSVPPITLVNPQQENRPLSSTAAATIVTDAPAAPLTGSGVEAVGSLKTAPFPLELSLQPTVLPLESRLLTDAAPALDTLANIPSAPSLQPANQRMASAEQVLDTSPANDEGGTELVQQLPAFGPGTLSVPEVEVKPALLFSLRQRKSVEGAAFHAAVHPDSGQEEPETAVDVVSGVESDLAEQEILPVESNLVRKARLSSLLAETFPPEQLRQEQAPQTQDTPMPSSVSTHLVRRARLTGFPLPPPYAADAHLQAAPLEGEPADQPTPLSGQPDGQTEATPEVLVAARANSGDVEEAAPASPVLTPSIGGPEPKKSPLVTVICFGTVDILVGGESLCPLKSRFRSSREFELMTFLAHWAATRRQAFADRATITEALLEEDLNDQGGDAENPEEREGAGGFQRSPLGGWRYRLCRRLRQMGILDQDWLEIRADGALRLRPEVRIDLIEFLQVASQLRKARDQLRRPDHKPVAHETVLEQLHQLQNLYRERGEFAEQFLLCEWTQEPRRRYRSIYWQSLWYAAELLAASKERHYAIQLAEELIEGKEVEAEPTFEALLTWLNEEGNKQDLLKWLHRYREWYAEAYPGQSLDIARADFVHLLLKTAKSL